jgi:ureidoacrylate peracid hydrolase
MQTIVPAEPESLTIDTDRTAVIVVDMQHAFCSKGGMLDCLGALDPARAERTIAADKKVLAAARHKGIQIIYLRMTYSPDLGDVGGPGSPNYYKEGGRAAMARDPQRKFLTRGGWDWQIVDELRPLTGDVVLDKSRYDGFYRTDLDEILKRAGVKYLIFLGIATNVCVESTLRDAYFHDYFPLLVSDGCGNIGPDSIQDATVFNVRSFFGWVTTADDLIKAISKPS